MNNESDLYVLASYEYGEYVFITHPFKLYSGWMVQCQGEGGGGHSDTVKVM